MECKSKFPSLGSVISYICSPTSMQRFQVKIISFQGTRWRSLYFDSNISRLTDISFCETTASCIFARALARCSKVSVVAFRSTEDDLVMDAFLIDSIALSMSSSLTSSFPIKLFTLKQDMQLYTVLNNKQILVLRAKTLLCLIILTVIPCQKASLCGLSCII